MSARSGVNNSSWLRFFWIFFVTGRVAVRDDALAVALVVGPLALVPIAVRVVVRPLAVHLAVDPLPDVLVAVRVRERAVPADAPVEPLALVAVAVGVRAGALAVDAVLLPPAKKPNIQQRGKRGKGGLSAPSREWAKQRRSATKAAVIAGDAVVTGSPS